VIADRTLVLHYLKESRWFKKSYEYIIQDMDVSDRLSPDEALNKCLRDIEAEINTSLLSQNIEYMFDRKDAIGAICIATIDRIQESDFNVPISLILKLTKKIMGKLVDLQNKEIGGEYRIQSVQLKEFGIGIVFCTQRG